MDSFDPPPVVVLAAHKNLVRLVALYASARPDTAHDLLVFLNGPRKQLEELAKRRPGDTLDTVDLVFGYPVFVVDNDPAMRDVDLYRQAVDHSGSPGRRFFFLNDDVVSIKGNTWLGEAMDLLEQGAPIAGIQWNLSTYAPREEIPEGSRRHVPFAFVRTFAFGATTETFRATLEGCETAQDFEKRTNRTRHGRTILDPSTMVDSNTLPHLAWLEAYGEHQRRGGSLR